MQLIKFLHIFTFTNCFIDITKLEDECFITALKLQKFLLRQDEDIRALGYMKDKINIHNVTTLYQLAKFFSSNSLTKITFNYILRCFTMVVQTKNFQELDHTLVSKILTSSDLKISSELEVFKAADLWLNYNLTDRDIFAKDLLTKVRLPLLSDHALKHLLKSSSAFSESSECTSILNDILDRKCFPHTSNIYYTNRYCKQNKFNILICGGGIKIPNEYDEYESSRIVYQVNGCNLTNTKTLPSLIEKRSSYKSVCLNAEVYVFGGLDDDKECVMSVEKYSFSTKTWSKVADMYDARDCFCACAFMDKVFVIGGCFYTNVDEYGFNVDDLNSCLEFSTKDNKWREVARMNQVRVHAACAVFEGKVVVSGGQGDDFIRLNTVESYDVIGNTWSKMANMINGKSNHSLIAISNKLFVIGSKWHTNGPNTCEVFDNSCKSFVALKSPTTEYFGDKVVLIDNKIVAFQSDTPFTICYDVDEDKWSSEPCEVTKNLSWFHCVKVPLI